MMKVKKIVIAQGFEYDEEIFVEAGTYDFVEAGTNGYPMILVNDEWLDLADFDSTCWVHII